MSAITRHPKALTYLFLTEMWERFGFYTVQGLIVLYMTQYFGFSDSDSYSISGTFTALVYISPLVGGYLSGKYIGYQQAVVWGGFFLILGYALLALPYAHTLIYPALATVIVGNGLLKPTISSLLGTQYSPHDHRRDSGFTIFYIGINVGAFLAGASSGYVKEYFGWSMSFALASIGIVIGLLTFAYGLRYIRTTHIRHPEMEKIKFSLNLIIYSILAIIGVTFILRMSIISSYLLPTAGIIMLIVLTILTLQQKAQDRYKMLTLNTLVLSSVAYWMLYFQMFLAANLYIDRLVDKQFLGLTLTTTIFYASESVFIILLGPIFAWLWHRLSRANKNPSSINKFIWGLFFAGLGFLVLTASTHFLDQNNLVSAPWIFFAYLLITIGELFISPIGLSAVTTLAPANLVGLMMGVWFSGIGFGAVFGGSVAKLASIPDTVHTISEKLAIYENAFLDFACMVFFMAIVLIFVKLGLKRLAKQL